MNEKEAAFYKKYKNYDVRITGDNFVNFYYKTTHIGMITITNDRYNCGLCYAGKLVITRNHKRRITDDKIMDMILEYVDIFVRGKFRYIIMYNTSSWQRDLREALERGGYYTLERTFRNKNSSANIFFHIKQL